MRFFKSKTFIIILSVLVVIFIAGEIIGRKMGLCSTPLFYASNDFEYMSTPNQHTKIYGNKYETNEFSMRSLPITKADTSDSSTVVLVIGDSIVNGGNPSDQDSLATTILEKEISHDLNKHVRVLNISSASWGPDNAVAYLKHYHTIFHAKFMCLVWSSHDSHDNMNFQKIVGVNPQFPDKQVPLAWIKIIERGWQMFAKLFQKTPSAKMSGDLGIATGKAFNSGFMGFKKLSDSLHVPIFFYFHVEAKELKKGRITSDGQQVVDFFKKYQIPYQEEFYNKDINPSYYRDFIHYNNKGQKYLAKQLYPVIMEHLKNDK